MASHSAPFSNASLIQDNPLTLNQKKTAYVASLCAFFISFLGYGISLDRYPLYYVDEPFFNYPAIHHLEGGRLTYRVSPLQPHGDTVFALHAPFYTHLQLLTFRFLGQNQFACRIPQYLSAYLAVLVLSVFLVRRGLWVPGLLLPLAWVGDRCAQEILYGRMEGLALLFLALGLICLVKTMEGAAVRWAIACGILVGTAAGFHPNGVYFGAVAFLLLGLWGPAGRRWKVMAGLAAGALIPTLLVAWCWSDDLLGAIEQFRWASRVHFASGAVRTTAKLLVVLGPSKFWWVGLVAVALLSLPFMIDSFVRRRSLGLAKEYEALVAAVFGFSLAGLLCVVLSVKFPYYLVYLSLWPVIGISTFLTSSTTGPRGWRKVAIGGAILLFACWIPSLFWNVMRFREAVLYRSRLDPSVFARSLARHIPPDIKLTGSPELFLIAKKAGLDFAPLPWLQSNTEVPAGTWILLTEGDHREGKRVAPEDLSARPLVFEGAAYPGTKYFEYRYVVFGPMRGRE